MRVWIGCETSLLWRVRLRASKQHCMWTSGGACFGDFRGGDNVNTYFSHLSRPSLEGYSIYVGSMLSFLLKSEHWSVGLNIGINMQSKFTLLRPLWGARCLVELRANIWYTISRPCPVLMLRWRMKMTLMKMIRLSLFRLILRLIRWNNPHLSPRGFLHQIDDALLPSNIGFVCWRQDNALGFVRGGQGLIHFVIFPGYQYSDWYTPINHEEVMSTYLESTKACLVTKVFLRHYSTFQPYHCWRTEAA